MGSNDLPLNHCTTLTARGLGMKARICISKGVTNHTADHAWTYLPQSCHCPPVHPLTALPPSPVARMSMPPLAAEPETESRSERAGGRNQKVNKPRPCSLALVPSDFSAPESISSQPGYHRQYPIPSLHHSGPSLDSPKTMPDVPVSPTAPGASASSTKTFTIADLKENGTREKFYMLLHDKGESLFYKGGRAGGGGSFGWHKSRSVQAASLWRHMQDWMAV